MTARSKAASRARATYSDELVERIAKRHADGAWLKHACALEGATYMGLRQAMEREPRWALRIEEAHAAGAEVIRDRLHAAGVEEHEDANGHTKTVRFGDWKREAWILERWDQETFHLRVTAPVSVALPPSNVVHVHFGDVSERRRVIRGEQPMRVIEASATTDEEDDET